MTTNDEVGEQTLRELRDALRRCGIRLPDSANLNAGVENFLRTLTVAALNAGDADDDGPIVAASNGPVMMSLDGNGNPQPSQRTQDAATVRAFFQTVCR